MLKLGDTIRRLRTAKSLTLAQLCEKSGIPMDALTSMENNKRAGSVNFHIMLAKALNLDLNEFIEEYEKDRLHDNGIGLLKSLNS
jgi:transcriptional regulator with XRE-family HTH domain